MNHLTEEQFVLHYYGEAGDGPDCERHLAECSECRAAYGALQRVLNVVDSLPVPERPADYGACLWQRIERQLPARRAGFWYAWRPWRWAAAGAALTAALLLAFLAGRFSRPGHFVPGRPAVMAADPQAGERILLVAVGDYLERSQMVLIELANANPKGPLDITAEQERAADLVGEGRLYRQTAEHAGDGRTAGMLEDLDRVLLEIAHAPSRLSGRELQDLHRRLKADGILFKIRVLDSNVRSQKQGSL
jgi:hypothetical protein